MNLSQRSLRGAEIWHIWKQHHVIECFWKIMKSIFQLRSMQLQGDGLYTALLIKVFAYLLALRLKAQGVFSKLTMTEIMRKLRREEDLRDFLMTHFHAPFSIRLRNSGDIEQSGILRISTGIITSVAATNALWVNTPISGGQSSKI